MLVFEFLSNSLLVFYVFPPNSVKVMGLFNGSSDDLFFPVQGEILRHLATAAQEQVFMVSPSFSFKKHLGPLDVCFFKIKTTYFFTRGSGHLKLGKHVETNIGGPTRTCLAGGTSAVVLEDAHPQAVTL